MNDRDEESGRLPSPRYGSKPPQSLQTVQLIDLESNPRSLQPHPVSLYTAAVESLADEDSIDRESSGAIYDNPNNIDQNNRPAYVGPVELLSPPIPQRATTATPRNIALVPPLGAKPPTQSAPNGLRNGAAVKLKADPLQGKDGCASCLLTTCCLLLILAFISGMIFVLQRRENGFGSIGGALTPTESPTVFPTLSPTLSPTPKPIAPTTSPTPKPTKNPTKSPTPKPTTPPTFAPTDSPTTSPTLSPTVSPTNSPTTTLQFVAGICGGSTNRIRTSMCIGESLWVRCEKDGSVVPTSDGNFVRKCASGDVCPCSQFSRLLISDPCVLQSDKEESQLTCSADD